MVRFGKRGIAIAALTVVASAIAWAAPIDGKWTWKQPGRQGGADVAMTLELKADDKGKLTGSIAREGSDMKTEIKDGKIEGQDISFITVVERNGMERKTMYKGKLDGDALKGNVISNRQGQEQSREWVANRVK